jgi:hypothetical protein
MKYDFSCTGCIWVAEEYCEHMNNETPEAIEGSAPYSYAGYVDGGGRIDEVNYQRVMRLASEGSSVGAIEEEVLYRILRNDWDPGNRNHHGVMSDQELRVETLRMLGDTDAVEAFKSAHPHMQFE